MKKTILPAEIEITLHPSKSLWGWLLVFSILCMACVWFCLPACWAVFITSVYLLSGYWQYQQLPATGGPYSPQQLRVDVYGDITLSNRAGQIWQIEVLTDSVVYGRWLVLHVRYLMLPESPEILPTRRLPTFLPLLADQMDADAFRRLKVFLLWR